MAWSVTIVNPGSYDGFPAGTHESWAREHEAYPRDADLGLQLAKDLGLRGVTIAGGRTPVPYAEDEIVTVTVTGTVRSSDFLKVVRDSLKLGPGEDTPVYRHYAAMGRLRRHPCRHDLKVLEEDIYQCQFCQVKIQRGLMWFDE